MKPLYFTPYDFELDEYAEYLANREYWDDAGFEWSGFHTMDEKLILLAGYVQKGGDLNYVIEKYSEDRDKEYTDRIQWSILHYLRRLISEGLPKEEKAKDTSHIRIMLLERDELVRLLSEELKRRVTYKLETVRPKNNPNSIDVVRNWYVPKPKTFDDTVLAQIEKEHKQAHPEETNADIKRRYDDWYEKSLF